MISTKNVQFFDPPLLPISSAKINNTSNVTNFKNPPPLCGRHTCMVPKVAPFLSKVLVGLPKVQTKISKKICNGFHFMAKLHVEGL